MKKSIFIAIIAILILMAAATSCVTVNIIPNGNIIPNENKISNENINQAENNGKVEQYENNIPNENINQAENNNVAKEYYGYTELHDPMAWDSSYYVPRSIDDSLVEIEFTWSTGEKGPRLLTKESGVYVFTYTEVYASGIKSQITQTFFASDKWIMIDPVVKVYYFWLSIDATPNVDVKEPYYLKPFKTIEVYASETPWYEIILRRQGLMWSRDLRNFPKWTSWEVRFFLNNNLKK